MGGFLYLGPFILDLNPFYDLICNFSCPYKLHLGQSWCSFVLQTIFYVRVNKREAMLGSDTKPYSPGKLPLQTPTLYLLQVYKWHGLLALTGYSTS
jgi:hypothetical protein